MENCTLFYSANWQPPTKLKLTILTYFEALITNMMIKIPANLIFKVKNVKKKTFLTCFSILCR